MRAQFINLNVRAHCPDCRGAVTTFESQSSNRDYGSVSLDASHVYQNTRYRYVLYILLKCAGCGRGGLATVHHNGASAAGVLGDFHPTSVEFAPLPAKVPPDITREFREAELCFAHQAFRAASALFRSTLEKVLKANGYQKGVLAAKIDEAADDGVITAARRQLVHENVRVLGNDVLHDDWRELAHEEVEESHRYCQRILEDLYDDRATVERVLVSKKRLVVNAAAGTPNP